MTAKMDASFFFTQIRNIMKCDFEMNFLCREKKKPLENAKRKCLMEIISFSK